MCLLRVLLHETPRDPTTCKTSGEPQDGCKYKYPVASEGRVRYILATTRGWAVATQRPFNDFRSSPFLKLRLRIQHRHRLPQVSGGLPFHRIPLPKSLHPTVRRYWYQYWCICHWYQCISLCRSLSRSLAYCGGRAVSCFCGCCFVSSSCEVAF